MNPDCTDFRSAVRSFTLLLYHRKHQKNGIKTGQKRDRFIFLPFCERN
nr:MAG TPA: hypothetical protein [Caudoviricetes sp.]